MPYSHLAGALHDGAERYYFSNGRGVYPYDKTTTAEWNRGDYLVQELGHCGECHTPCDILGGMKPDYELTGAFIDRFSAPNIMAQGLGHVSIQNIIDIF